MRGEIGTNILAKAKLARKDLNLSYKIKDLKKVRKSIYRILLKMQKNLGENYSSQENHEGNFQIANTLALDIDQLKYELKQINNL